MLSILIPWPMMSYIDKNTTIVNSFKNLINSIVSEFKGIFLSPAWKKQNKTKDNHANAIMLWKKIINSTLTGFARIYYKPTKMFKSRFWAHIM